MRLSTRKPGIGDVVFVDWEDSWFEEDDRVASELVSVSPMTTVGILIRHTGEVVSIAQEFYDGRYRHIENIPTHYIKRGPVFLHKAIEEE